MQNDRRPISVRDQFLLNVVDFITNASPSTECILRGSLAANALGWTPRLAEDIDLVSAEPLAVDLSVLDGHVIDGLRCEFTRVPEVINFGRPGISVLGCWVRASSRQGEVFSFGIDVGTREHDYDVECLDDSGRRAAAAEWLAAEKVHLIQRRYSRYGQLHDVRCRDVIDLARWADVGLREHVGATAAEALRLDLEVMLKIEVDLVARQHPRYWHAQWRKAQTSAHPRMGVASLPEAWSVVAHALLR